MSEILEQETEPKYIEIYIQETGDLSRIVKDFELYKGQYIDYYIDIYVPITLSPSVEGHGVAVQTALMYTKRNGSLKTTIGYNAVIKETGVVKYGRTYNVYEQRIPQVYVKHIGEQTLIANINEIDTTTDPAEFVQIITSQTCPLVIQMSDYIDDEEVPDPSQLDLLQAEVNDLILNKQDKVDTSIQTNSWQDSQTVVGAINNNTEQTELNRQQIATNTGNISNNTSRIATNEQDISSIKAEQLVQNESINTNTSDIADLKAIVGTGENYIGGMGGTLDPTIPGDLASLKAGLNQYVRQKTGRAPQGGDVVIYWQNIEGGTDKNYKFIYSGSQSDWTFYLIPGAETASNTDKGILKGNYNTNDTTHKIQVNVINGDIEDVYLVNNRDEHVRLGQYLNSGEQAITNLELQVGANTTNIGTLNGKVGTLENTTTNILNGTTPVGKATSADNDGNGNNIVNTYLTQTAGVTKVQLREYALPRAFNDVSYLTSTGYSDEVPTDVNPIYSETSTAVGDTELFSAEKTIVNAEFDLGAKNSSTDTIYVSASEVCNVQFRLTTEVYNDSQWHTASIELSDNVQFTLANEIKKIQFGSTFTQLNDVLKIVENDKIRQTLEVVTNTSESITFNVYSNETYPSTFYLNTTSQTIMVSQGDLGEVLTITLTGVYDSEQDTLTFDIPEGLIINDSVMAQFILTLPSGVSDATQVLFVQGNQDIITMVVPTLADNRTVPTLKDMNSVLANGKLYFTGVFELNNSDIYLYTSITLGGDTDNLVTLDTAQTITGKKTFLGRALEFISNNAPNKLEIYNDNGYNAKIRMGGAENIRLMGTSTSFGTSVLPITDNSKSLGGTNYRWVDLHLSGNLTDGTNSIAIANIANKNDVLIKPLTLSTTTMTDEQIAQLRTYNCVLTNDLVLGTTSLKAGTLLTVPFEYSGSLRGIAIYNNKIMTYYINLTSKQMSDGAKDIVISQVANINTDKVTIDNYTINKDSFGQLQIGNNNATSMQFDGSTVRSNNLVPMGNNSKDLGSSSQKWKDLYLAGNLSDGTDSVAVNKIATTDTAQTISGAKTFSSTVVANDGVRTNLINGLSGSTNIQVGKDMLPGTTNALDLGNTSRKWKDLYLAGNLTDGTNSTTIADITGNISDVSDIQDLIPSQATDQNQLADKAFVNSTIQTNTANFRGNWATWSAVPTTATDYPEDYAGNKTPTVNDYLVVEDASGYSGQTLTGTWRFKYTGDWATNGKSGWLPEYQVNETPLTAAQLAALNSGITSTAVAQIGTNTTNIALKQNSTDNTLATDDKTIVGSINEIVEAVGSLGQDVEDGFTAIAGELNGKQATLTTAQQNAVDSGIDSTKVAQIGTNASDIASLQTSKQDALPTTTTAGQVLKSTSTAGTVEWGTVQSGGVTDVKINNVSVVSSGVANLSTNTAYNASTNKIATMSDVPSTTNSVTSGSTSALTSGGAYTNLVSDVTYDSTNKKLKKTKNGSTTDLVTLGTQATYSLSGTTLTITTL